MLLLEAAKEWGIPPWQIEDDAPAVWMERWRVMREESASEVKRKSKAKKRG